MFNTLKNAFFLSIINSVVVTGLLLGLNFAPNYAAAAEVTYYAFVMHQPKGGKWQLPKSGKLTVGSYRFQIVRVPGGDTQLEWIALRGEFEFVADPAGGVRLANQHTLDELIPQIPENVSYSLWWNISSPNIDNWKKAREKWVQPLISQMNNILKQTNKSGTPDPNFMRFLLKKGVNEEWKGKQNENYRLYRLHYLKAYDFLNRENYRKAFSRFIDPSGVTADIQTLKQWVEAQESFQKAAYLGNADEKHKEFYRDFQILFNQLSETINQLSETIKQIAKRIETVQQTVQGSQETAKEAKQNADEAQQAVEMAVKAGISDEEMNRKNQAANEAVQAANNATNQAREAKRAIEAAIAALKANNAEKANEQIERARNAVSAVQSAADKAKEAAVRAKTIIKSLWRLLFYFVLGIGILLSIIIAAWLLADKMQNWRSPKQDNDIDQDFDEQLSRTNRVPGSKPRIDQDIGITKPSLSHAQRNKPGLSGNELQQTPMATTHLLKEQIDELNNRLLTLESRKQFSPGVDNNTIGNQAVSQDEVSNLVFKILNANFSKITSKLFQSSEFKDAMESQINAYLHDQFNKDVNRTIKSHAEHYWGEFIEKSQKTQVPSHPLNTCKKQPEVPNNNLIVQPQQPSWVNKAPEVSQQSQQTDATVNNMSDKIKTVLLSMKSVDETALMTLDVSVEPCLFVTNVVANCLKLNQPVTHYQRLDSAIKELTDSKVSLIISKVGDDILSEEHHVVAQQTATKGKLNVVASLIRPGVRCDNIIRRKAEVIQNA